MNHTYIHIRYAPKAIIRAIFSVQKFIPLIKKETEYTYSTK